MKTAMNLAKTLNCGVKRLMATACTNGIDTGFVALGYAKVAVLGVVQGITELMPISSTAHMRIAPALFGWQDPGSAFSAAMQLAALAAVIGYFWRDVKDILHGSLSALARRDFSDHSLKFAFGIVIGTIPIGIAGLALAKTLNTCGSPLRELWVVGAACLVMAFLLGLAELAARHQRSFDRVGLLDCLLVGIAQVGALIPGVKELAELRHAGLDAHGWAVLGIGLVVASLSAFVAIWGLLRILENFSAWPFAVYRALIGAVLLASLATGWLS